MSLDFLCIDAWELNYELIADIVIFLGSGSSDFSYGD